MYYNEVDECEMIVIYWTRSPTIFKHMFCGVYLWSNT